jgi:multiple sugar transport system substrate-binding protein
MRRLRALVVVLSVVLVASSCAGGQAPGAASPGGQPGAGGSWWANAAAPYKGVTLRGVSESTPPSNYAKDVLAPAFEKETGIKVQLETTSWDQMYDKAIKDMEARTGIYDFVYVEQDIIYAYLDRKFLVDVSQTLSEKGNLAAPDFKLDNFTSFINYFKDQQGHVYGVPMEAFVKVYLYRKDLFEDAEAKSAFQQKYGRQLAPAKTFDEYRQNAEFFTQWGKDKKLELWGTTVQATSGHPASFYEFVETILPSFGVYNWGINQERWKASEAAGGQLNGAKAKEALTFWLDMLKYAPPEATSSTWDEVGATFEIGRASCRERV